MRLDSALDSLYVLGSLWSGPSQSRVCWSDPAPAAERPAATAREAVTAFVDVNVVPMDTERVLAHQTVVVADGRVTALGPVGQVPVPAGAVRVDGRGKYLMPGLTDMHIHQPEDLRFNGSRVRLGTDTIDDQLLRRGYAFPANGVTGFRTLAEDGTGPTGTRLHRLRQAYQMAETPSPRLFLPRAFPGRRSSMFPDRILTPTDSVAAYVAAAKAAGYAHLGFRDFEPRRDSAYFAALVTAARQTGLPISEHSHFLPLEAILGIASTGGSIEHTTTLLLALGYKIYDENVSRVEVSMPEFRQVAATLGRAGLWMNPSFDCQYGTSEKVKNFPQVVRALHDGGVKFLLAGDESSVQRELTAMVLLAGLTPYQALLTGTRHVAEYFREAAEFGTVAVGKRADLVLLYGNPLKSTTPIWEPAGVMIEGRWLDRAALDRGLLSEVERGGSLALVMNAIPSEEGGRRRGGLRTVKGQQEYWEKFKGPKRAIKALADSLKAAAPADRSARERIVQRLAQEFSALRPLLPLTPTQQARLLIYAPDTQFDAALRLWLREQERQGARVTIPGLSPLP